ncbi:MAG: membrane protein insertase YidC [Rhodospirillales bacterium]|nr:membrane protein insertase YidC [Rhodospirillales bacterium]
MQIDQRNLIIAIALSLAIVLGFEFFYNMPRLERDRALRAERAASQTTSETITPAPGIPVTGATAPKAGAPAAAPKNRSPAAVMAGQPRVRIDAPDVQGSILLVSGRIDDLQLVTYRETIDPKSPAITLLSPQGTANPYFAEFGWVAGAPEMTVPGPDTLWTADRTTLTPATPVTLSWENGQGLRFELRYAIDANFMFQITQRVINKGDAPVQVHPYGLAARSGTPQTQGYYILHEGPIGVFDGRLKEPSYEDLRKAKRIDQTSTGGWIGITDKYWLVALVPDQKRSATMRFNHAFVGGEDRYQVDYLDPPATVAPGASTEVANRLFAGAKEVRLLDNYAETLGIERFDLAVDFGWFYFLTKPIFLVLDYFYRQIGNFGLAILLLTVLIKLLFFPLANKSYRAMSKMKLLQPEMEKLRERFGEDRQRLSQEMMALYKRQGANPLAGCLPVVIQIPVFFALYKVLFITIEMRHAPFYGWIQDLSVADPTSLFNLFGLLPFAVPAFLHIGAWPIIMGVTMFLQQKMNPQPPDPIQAKMFLAMPFIFTFILASFPAGLVIYWAWNNLLSILQQWVIMRQTAAHQAAK